jgi:hypothetical protein
MGDLGGDPEPLVIGRQAQCEPGLRKRDLALSFASPTPFLIFLMMAR